MLISGDPGFAYALSVLRMRNYRNLVLLGPRLEQENASFASQAALCLNWDVEILHRTVPSSTPQAAAEDNTVNEFELGVEITRDSAGLSKSQASSPHGVIGDRRRSTSFPSPPARPPAEEPPSVPPVVPPVGTASPIKSLEDDDLRAAIPEADVHTSSSRLEPRPDSVASTEEEAGTWGSNSTWAGGQWAQGSRSTKASSSHPSTENASPPPPEEEDVVHGATDSKSYAQTAKFPSGFYDHNSWAPAEPVTPSSLDDWQTASSKRKTTDTAITGPDLKLFKPLIRVLKESRANGAPKPLWGTVAFEILKIDQRIYEKAGVQKFVQYAELAVAKKIVQIGGPNCQQWMRLHPNFKG